MKTLLRKGTQEYELYTLLKNRGETGVTITEMIAPRPVGLHIPKYTSVISNLRKKGYNVVNSAPYVYTLGGYERPVPETAKEVNDEPFDYKREKQKYQTLRKKYVQLRDEDKLDTTEAKILVIQGKALKHALNQYKKVGEALI